jgi:hypothetical protein
MILEQGMRIFLGAVVILLLTACATPPPTPGAQLAAAETGDKKTCKNMPVMGSNFTKKVCATQAEWEAFARQGQEGVDQFEADRSTAGTQGGLTGQ